MAALMSAKRGQRALSWRDMLAGFGAAWVLPVPVGLAMLVLPLLYQWPFQAAGLQAPAQGPVSYIFGLGWVVLFAPALSWIGLVLAVPLVWLVLRIGLGGWVSFALGGAAIGALVASLLDGMHALFPALMGAICALTCRTVLQWLRPEAFDPERDFGRDPV